MEVQEDPEMDQIGLVVSGPRNGKKYPNVALQIYLKRNAAKKKKEEVQSEPTWS
jgi:hypothetical protein